MEMHQVRYFLAVTRTLKFAPGVVTLTVAVKVIDDDETEPVETFALNLSAPHGATIADNQGVGTITDDD